MTPRLQRLLPRDLGWRPTVLGITLLYIHHLLSTMDISKHNHRTCPNSTNRHQYRSTQCNRMAIRPTDRRLQTLAHMIAILRIQYQMSLSIIPRVRSYWGAPVRCAETEQFLYQIMPPRLLIQRRIMQVSPPPPILILPRIPLHLLRTNRIILTRRNHRIHIAPLMARPHPGPFPHHPQNHPNK